MAGAWASERLIYRAVETDDEVFLSRLGEDSIAYMQMAPFIPVPQGKTSATKYREWLQAALLAVIICLPAPAPATTATTPDDASTKPIPVGVTNLFPIDPRQPQHLKTEIGIQISGPYRGQGYGSEAIKWVLDFAFRRANMHRVGITAAGYNPGAIQLYKRLGFIEDGRFRDFAYHDGQYWPEVHLAMLEDEWRERYGKKE